MDKMGNFFYLLRSLPPLVLKSRYGRGNAVASPSQDPFLDFLFYASFNWKLEVGTREGGGRGKYENVGKPGNP